MSVFYFTETKPNEDNLFEATKVYELSCTTSISIRSSARVTSSPVEDGTSIVDNYYLENRDAEFNGLITNIRVSGIDHIPVAQWISELNELRASKKLLTLVADTEVIPNCVITSFSLDKNKDQGLSGWRCNLAFKEVTISERARLVEVKKPKPAEKDKVGGKSKNGNTTSEQVDNSLATTSFLDVVDAVKG